MSLAQKNFNIQSYLDYQRDNPSRLKLFCEGDSWFRYPDTNVLTHLARKRHAILSRARNGDTVESMLNREGLESLRGYLSRWTRPKTARRESWKFDAILFSGGGNDFAGDQLVHFLNRWEGGMRPADALKDRSVDGRLDLIEQAVEELIELRNELQPHAAVLLHDYGKVFADGRKARVVLRLIGVGPWLQPSMDFRGIPRDEQTAVARALLKRFADRMSALAGRHDRVHVVRTSRAIENNKSRWANELHPRSAGFRQAAGAFHKTLERKVS